MSETKAKKPKRVLSNIDFSKSDSHIALVSSSQGGPANGADYALVIKANKFSPEFVEKASKVTVTLDIVTFLQKFFYMYWEDATVLAKAMGYDTEVSDEDKAEDYEDYIDKKVASISIMKSIKEAESIEKGLSVLTEDQYLLLLQDQEKLEKVIKGLAPQGASQASTEITLVENKKVEPNSGSDESKLEKSNMTTQTVEMVEKSQLVALQKALDDVKAELQKALDDVKVYKAKEKEAIAKMRLEKLKDAVKDEDKAQLLMKSVGAMESDEDFTAQVEMLAKMTANVEKSALFEEKGAKSDADPAAQESPVAKAVKARIAKK